MSGLQGEFVTQLSAVAGMEDQLVATLARAANEVAHSECFDSEQRAEVYTILDTLKADTAAHKSAVGQWVSDRGRDRGDA